MVPSGALKTRCWLAGKVGPPSWSAETRKGPEAIVAVGEAKAVVGFAVSKPSLTGGMSRKDAEAGSRPAPLSPDPTAIMVTSRPAATAAIIRAIFKVSVSATDTHGLTQGYTSHTKHGPSRRADQYRLGRNSMQTKPFGQHDLLLTLMSLLRWRESLRRSGPVDFLGSKRFVRTHPRNVPGATSDAPPKVCFAP